MAEEKQDIEINQSTWWDLLVGVLVFFAMMTVATRLVSTNWVKNLDLVQTVTLLGIIAGLALGRSFFSRPFFFLFFISFGLSFSPLCLNSSFGIGNEWSDRLII